MCQLLGISLYVVRKRERKHAFFVSTLGRNIRVDVQTKNLFFVSVSLIPFFSSFLSSFPMGEGRYDIMLSPFSSGEVRVIESPMKSYQTIRHFHNPICLPKITTNTSK